jgi:hypothetical protein
MLLLAGGMACAQYVPEVFNPLSHNPSGIHLYGVSAHTSYYSTGLPESFGYIPGQNLQGDVSMGGAASFGWVRSGPSSSFSIGYSPSYTGRVRYSEWNAFNHAL